MCSLLRVAPQIIKFSAKFIAENSDCLCPKHHLSYSLSSLLYLLAPSFIPLTPLFQEQSSYPTGQQLLSFPCPSRSALQRGLPRVTPLQKGEEGPPRIGRWYGWFQRVPVSNSWGTPTELVARYLSGKSVINHQSI